MMPQTSGDLQRHAGNFRNRTASGNLGWMVWLKAYAAGFALAWLIVGVIFYVAGSDSLWQVPVAVVLGVVSGSGFYRAGAFRSTASR
jgi:hypothetical protein